jgi:hypothetical protein
MVVVREMMVLIRVEEGRITKEIVDARGVEHNQNKDK